MISNKSIFIAVALAVLCNFLPWATTDSEPKTCQMDSDCRSLNGVDYLCDNDKVCRPTQVSQCGNENGPCCAPHILAQNYICAGRSVCAYNKCTDLVKTLNLNEFCTVMTELLICHSNEDCAVTSQCDLFDNKCRPSHVNYCGSENATCCPPNVLANKYICEGDLLCNAGICTDLVDNLNLNTICAPVDL